MALATRPRLLLLDEPTAGMSVEETARTGELVKRLNDDGTTIVAIEHDMAFVRQVATESPFCTTAAYFAKEQSPTLRTTMR